MKEEIDLRFSSKSMQNTQCTTSPIKNAKKIKSFSIKSKDFKPNSIKYGEENIQKDFEEEQFDPHFIEPAVGSFIEMSMYQLLNERLTTYANTNISNPFDQSDHIGNFGYSQPVSKSKSVPTNDKSCEFGDTFDFETTENAPDESSFYERVDHEICCYVSEIDQLLASVAEERDILLNKVILNLCMKAFPNSLVKIDVFGSLVTGLALETSDMDLVITGLKIESREDTIEHIKALTQHFGD